MEKPIQKINKQPKSMQELFNTMQEDVSMCGHLADEYLEELEKLLNTGSLFAQDKKGSIICPRCGAMWKHSCKQNVSKKK
jgi:uncharacterized protein Yka (UPF0111/DUF47 family)